MIPSVTLKNGVKMPVLGLGTWQLSGADGIETLKSALALGYTHIDTAEMYGNEKEIGKAIAGHDRKKLFITSKVWHVNLRKKDVLAACAQTLKNLDTPYLDLYLIHWPNAAIPLEETLDALQQLHDEGKVRAIGVSNFTVRHLERALRHGAQISVNQVEFHPQLYQEELLAFCAERHIKLTAYSPLGHGELVSDPVVQAIATAHAKAPSQVLLRWAFEKGVIAIPKASSTSHLKENIDIFGFELGAEEMRRLDTLPQRRVVNPGFAEF